MKKSAVVLVVSLLANGVLLAVFLAGRSGGQAVAPPAMVAAPRAAEATAKLSAAQLAALVSGDAAALQAAGFPAETARLLAVGQAYARMQARMGRLAKAIHPDESYWKRPLYGFGMISKADQAEIASAQKEYTEAIRSLFGEEQGAAVFQGQRYSYLSAAKREQLFRIEQDYGEMQTGIYMEMSGMQLPSDQQKLRLLEEEKKRDLQAALSPEEFEQVNLHESQTAQMIRQAYGSGIQSEADYRKIFALQKAYDDRYAPNFFSGNGQPSEETMRAQAAAQQQLQNDLRNALGEPAYAALLHASDQDVRTLDSLAQRLNLPDGTTDQILTARDRYAALSQGINQDPNLSPEDRRRSLQDLAKQASADLQKNLGAEGTQVYEQRSSWLNLLKTGNAFSTDTKNAPRGMLRPGASMVFAPAKSAPAPGTAPAPTK